MATAARHEKKKLQRRAYKAWAFLSGYYCGRMTAVIM
jgi:hypothetical protein